MNFNNIKEESSTGFVSSDVKLPPTDRRSVCWHIRPWYLSSFGDYQQNLTWSVLILTSYFFPFRAAVGFGIFGSHAGYIRIPTENKWPSLVWSIWTWASQCGTRNIMLNYVNAGIADARVLWVDRQSTGMILIKGFWCATISCWNVTCTHFQCQEMMWDENKCQSSKSFHHVKG